MNPQTPLGGQEPAFSRLRWRALGKILLGLLGIYLLWPTGMFAAFAKMHGTENTVHSVPVQWLIFMGRIIPSHIAEKLISIPFVIVGIGLLEVVANRPFRRISAAWDELKQSTCDWICFLIACLFFAGAALAVHLLTLKARSGG